jgi:demethylmenaquinone methyltransferase/2-methoxy-6-polyprenyl-1,4-benzoquinol methylase
MFTSEFINDIFSKVAGKYDLMNDVMSFGVHRLWKKQFCKLVTNLEGEILDVASGSGDIAFTLYKQAKRRFLHPRITLSDINPSMLNLAKNKAINAGWLDKNLQFVEADATKLPFADSSFDYYTIAFGIRNVIDKQNALNEAWRVLKPNAKFLCLEFSKPTALGFKDLYRLYCDHIIPKFGAHVADSQEAYQYLVESIRQFPDQHIFTSMMRQAGFKIASFQNLHLSLATIYVGYKT